MISIKKQWKPYVFVCFLLFVAVLRIDVLKTSTPMGGINRGDSNNNNNNNNNNNDHNNTNSRKTKRNAKKNKQKNTTTQTKLTN